MQPVLALVVLVVVQLALGSGTWVVNYAWPTWMHRFDFASGTTLQAGSFWQAVLVTGHQATGSLILAFSVVLALRSLRLLPAKSSKSRGSIKLKGVLA